MAVPLRAIALSGVTVRTEADRDAEISPEVVAAVAAYRRARREESELYVEKLRAETASREAHQAWQEAINRIPRLACEMTDAIMRGRLSGEDAAELDRIMGRVPHGQG